MFINLVLARPAGKCVARPLGQGFPCSHAAAGSRAIAESVRGSEVESDREVVDMRLGSVRSAGTGLRSWLPFEQVVSAYRRGHESVHGLAY
jgi:hypothetical protein